MSEKEKNEENLKIKILLPILITLALIAAGLFVFQLREDKREVNIATTQENQTNTNASENNGLSVGTVSTAEVDNTLNDVDKSINAVDPDGFKETQISDAELGL